MVRTNLAPALTLVAALLVAGGCPGASRDEIAVNELAASKETSGNVPQTRWGLRFR
jgi:hypothetical protein